MANDDNLERQLAQPLSDDEGDAETREQHGDLDVHSHADGDEAGHAFPIPVWMRESSKSFRWRWVPLPLRKAGRAIATWTRGPQPPVELEVKPFFPSIQEWPLRMMDRFIPKRKHRIMLLVLLYISWFLPWALVLRHVSSEGEVKGYGKPNNIWCGYNQWSEGNKCGLGGNQCRPFSGNILTFRCPANCAGVKVLEPHHVGNEEVVYRPLVVGGPSDNSSSSSATYRADSFVCQAAIHAGVISDARGGCGVMVTTGAADSYIGSKRYGIESISFPAAFPKSYSFLTHLGQVDCPKESRWPLLAITIAPLALIFLFTTSPAAVFFSTFFILFLHVAMVSDPPAVGPVPGLVSILVSRLLPATFIAYILFHTSAIPLLTGCKAQVEKTILYLGFALIGALNNYTFAPLIPIQRLTPHDIANQPGAKAALVIVVILIFVIALGQAYYMQQSGVFLKYLKLYSTFVLSLIILLLLPGLRLRIHHYILALLLMPGTAIRTRPSLLYQGLLLGLYINGIARWGFASILQTPAMLGENPSGNNDGSPGRWWGSYIPNVTAVVAPDVRNITFHWGPLPLETGIEGVSVLVNDVERWRAYVDEDLGDGYMGDSEGFTWKRRSGVNETDFFRFAWMRGASTGLYTRPGTWTENGSWIEPEKGGTRWLQSLDGGGWEL